MPINDKEVRLCPGGQEASAHGPWKLHMTSLADVRSTVESQFRQMEQAHDRIRAEELARASLTDH